MVEVPLMGSYQNEVQLKVELVQTIACNQWCWLGCIGFPSVALNQHDICDKIFSKNSGIKKHQRIHNDEKSHECEYCYKRFADQSKLVSHQSIHRGEKPYTCEICEKSFTRSSNL